MVAWSPFTCLPVAGHLVAWSPVACLLVACFPATWSPSCRSAGCLVACFPATWLPGHLVTPRMEKPLRIRGAFQIRQPRSPIYRALPFPWPFKQDVIEDIRKLVRICERDNLRPAVRLNGTSDIAWEREWRELFDMFPQVQFYDYTKDPSRLAYSHYLPTNYHLTGRLRSLSCLRGPSGE
jgi:hypothetical protein